MVRSDIKAYQIGLRGLILGFFTGHAFYAVLLYRIANFFVRHHIKFLPGVVGHILLRRFACEISPYATIGKGFRLHHTPGIVIGWGVQIGDDCEVFQNVTIGENRRESEGQRFPIIGDRCTIYAGACVIGPIRLGDGCRVGANSVVTHDVPANTTVAGIPARPLSEQE